MHSTKNVGKDSFTEMMNSNLHLFNMNSTSHDCMENDVDRRKNIRRIFSAHNSIKVVSLLKLIIDDEGVDLRFGNNGTNWLEF